MASVLWEHSTRGGNPLTVMSTQLDALASGSGAIGAEVDNGDALDLYCDAELVVTFGTAPADGGTVDLYFVRQVDGTNYEDAVTGASEVPPRNGYVGSFFVRNATANRIVIPECRCPPRDFKFYVVNNTNQAFPASGSTVKAFFYRFKTSS